MSGREKETVAKQAETGKVGAHDEPEWAAGLKQLYDGVVGEPLPDSFKDLLAKLDDGSEKK